MASLYQRTGSSVASWTLSLDVASNITVSAAAAAAAAAANNVPDTVLVLMDNLLFSLSALRHVRAAPAALFSS